jgi:DNA-binding MarR family transcriptional regulator/GNAT superfamily N-acetyltransferase
MIHSGKLGHVETVREFNRFYTQKIGVLGSGWLGSDYSLTEVRVLYEIAHRPDTVASDLVRDLALDPGYLSRILSAFAKRGWMKRERSRSDARKSHLKLTAKGRKVFDSLDRRARDQINDLLAPLQPEQQQRLHGHLQGVQALLSRATRDTQDVILREHRPGDMGWIIQRHGAYYAGEYGWTDEFEALVAEICAAFIRNLDPSCERCWIAERNGTPVGCVMLVKHSRTVAKLRLLLVEPSERGTGLGRRLVAECVEYARRMGYQTMTLWTQSILTAARRIYETNGFRLVKSEPHESFGAKLVGETWELSLSAAATGSASRQSAAPQAS